MKKAAKEIKIATYAKSYTKGYHQGAMNAKIDAMAAEIAKLRRERSRAAPYAASVDDLGTAIDATAAPAKRRKRAATVYDGDEAEGAAQVVAPNAPPVHAHGLAPPQDRMEHPLRAASQYVGSFL